MPPIASGDGAANTIGRRSTGPVVTDAVMCGARPPWPAPLPATPGEDPGQTRCTRMPDCPELSLDAPVEAGSLAPPPVGPDACAGWVVALTTANDPSGRAANVTEADPPAAPEAVPYGTVIVTVPVLLPFPAVAGADAPPPVGWVTALMDPGLTPLVALTGVSDPSGRAASVTTSDPVIPGAGAVPETGGIG